MRALTAFSWKAYYHTRGITPTEVSRASWRKSALSTMNGNCVEIGRLAPDRIGIRDTKDHGRGPALVFTSAEWDAFMASAKNGEFDSI
jgi:Domain of unknown function (DUF397)